VCFIGDASATDQPPPCDGNPPIDFAHLSHAYHGPAELLAYANRHLCRKKIGGFVTAFLGIYDPDSGQLVYASAGTTAADQDRRQSVDHPRRRRQLSLGIDAAESFKTATVQLRPGDTLLLYTDGITEARDINQTMFEQQQLEMTLAQSSDRPDEIIKICAPGWMPIRAAKGAG